MSLGSLLPLGELSLSGILQLWNQRFLVSGSLGGGCRFSLTINCQPATLRIRGEISYIWGKIIVQRIYHGENRSKCTQGCDFPL